jgi:hypothetical protein
MASLEKLNVFNGVVFDELISSEELHTYQPYGSSKFANTDEIRIRIQRQDLLTSVSDSFLYIEGNLKKTEATKTCTLTNNSMAFLFDEVRLELNGQEIDSTRQPGIASTLKGLASYNESESKALQAAGWYLDFTEPADKSMFVNTRISACIPLKHLLGSAEDYKKVFINTSLELILIRSKTDDNCFKSETKASIEIDKIQWKVPHIKLNEEAKLDLLKQLNKNAPINIAFRKWDLYELPSLRAATADVWPVKTSRNLEKPRYVIVGFQKNRKNNKAEDSSRFDHTNLTNIKLHLHDVYPYEQWNLDIGNNQYALAYQSYANFQKSYYNHSSQPLITYKDFHKSFIYVIDCSKQNESLKSSTVDIRLEFESESAIPFTAETSVYALILHDCLIQYRPLDGDVRKL